MSVFGPDLEPALDPSTWEWIPAALGEVGTVGEFVPAGYEVVARVGHGEPRSGAVHGLSPEVLDSVLELGRAATSTPDDVRIAVWEGWGWESTTVLAARAEPRRLFRRSAPPPDPLAGAKELLAAELATLPHLELAIRRYHLLAGPLDAIAEMHDPVTVWSRFVPDLFWPVDRAWFVVGDTDWEWTYVAGPASLVEGLEDRWPDLVSRVEWTDRVS